eukprot:GFYU01003364.1.p1 GENE.GFYU01003364.1~~GFYU01003364.1.p1  ORF type:complete len:370 (-),score=99.83 GFYU01003364.1:1010-2119(-)
MTGPVPTVRKQLSKDELDALVGRPLVPFFGDAENSINEELTIPKQVTKKFSEGGNVVEAREFVEGYFVDKAKKDAKDAKILEEMEGRTGSPNTVSKKKNNKRQNSPPTKEKTNLMLIDGGKQSKSKKGDKQSNVQAVILEANAQYDDGVQRVPTKDSNNNSKNKKKQQKDETPRKEKQSSTKKAAAEKSNKSSNKKQQQQGSSKETGKSMYFAGGDFENSPAPNALPIPSFAAGAKMGGPTSSPASQPFASPPCPASPNMMGGYPHPHAHPHPHPHHPVNVHYPTNMVHGYHASPQHRAIGEASTVPMQHPHMYHHQSYHPHAPAHAHPHAGVHAPPAPHAYVAQAPSAQTNEKASLELRRMLNISSVC